MADESPDPGIGQPGFGAWSNPLNMGVKKTAWLAGIFVAADVLVFYLNRSPARQNTLLMLGLLGVFGYYVWLAIYCVKDIYRWVKRRLARHVVTQ